MEEGVYRVFKKIKTEGYKKGIKKIKEKAVYSQAL